MSNFGVRSIRVVEDCLLTRREGRLYAQLDEFALLRRHASQRRVHVGHDGDAAVLFRYGELYVLFIYNKRGRRIVARRFAVGTVGCVEQIAEIENSVVLGVDYRHAAGLRLCVISRAQAERRIGGIDDIYVTNRVCGRKNGSRCCRCEAGTLELHVRPEHGRQIIILVLRRADTGQRLEIRHIFVVKLILFKTGRQRQRELVYVGVQLGGLAC